MRLNSQQIKMFNKEVFFEKLKNNPRGVINVYFSDLDDFKEAALDCSIKDLKELIKLFQSHELHEYCAVMQDLIDNLLYE